MGAFGARVGAATFLFFARGTQTGNVLMDLQLEFLKRSFMLCAEHQNEIVM